VNVRSRQLSTRDHFRLTGGSVMFPKEIKILIVDDMKTMRMLVKKNLGQLGFDKIAEAEDGVLAWQQIEKSINEMAPFNLIISDWTMPNMTGLDLLKKVRSHPKVASTPFIMLTAEADVALIKQAIGAGVSNYITKPFSAEPLKEKLAAVHAKEA